MQLQPFFHLLRLCYKNNRILLQLLPLSFHNFYLTWFLCAAKHACLVWATWMSNQWCHFSFTIHSSSLNCLKQFLVDCKHVISTMFIHSHSPVMKSCIWNVMLNLNYQTVAVLSLDSSSANFVLATAENERTHFLNITAESTISLYP